MYFISKTSEPIISSNIIWPGPTRLSWDFSSEYRRVGAFAGITGSEHGLSGYTERRPLRPGSAWLVAVPFAFPPSQALQGMESLQPPQNRRWEGIAVCSQSPQNQKLILVRLTVALESLLGPDVAQLYSVWRGQEFAEIPCLLKQPV